MQASTAYSHSHSVPSTSTPPHSENVEIEQTRVQQALEVVFSPTQQQQQQQPSEWTRPLADRYLTTFQTLPVAWMVCDRLLALPSTSTSTTGTATSPTSTAPTVANAAFFAAQTLHTKCQRDVHQLPIAALPSLRDSLLQHLNRFSQSTHVPNTNGSTTTPVRPQASVTATRLAMAVAALAIQMQWTTVIHDLLSSSASTTPTITNTTSNPSTTQQQQQSPWIPLVIQALAEECDSERLCLPDESYRYQMQHALLNVAEKALQACPTFAVWLAWIRHLQLPPNLLAQQTYICQYTLETLQAAWKPQYSSHAHTNNNTNDDDIEDAMDVLVEVLRKYPSHIAQNQGLIQLWLPALLKTLPLEQALQSKMKTDGSIHGDDDDDDDDDEMVRGYCRIATELGESYLSLLWEQPHPSPEASQIVHWVLLCSRTNCATMTLPFWYRFAMELEAVEPSSRRQELIDHYSAPLLQLIDALVTLHLKYPPDLELLREDLLEELHRHRFNVSETMEDCCRLLGGQVVLERIGQRLFVAPQAHEPQKDWRDLEACLFAIQSLHRYIPKDENDYLPHVMTQIPQLPPDIAPLRFTASLLIGKYAAWLQAHPEPYLSPLLPYLAQGLTMPKCATAAAVAIKELCETLSLGDSVVQLYLQVSDQLELGEELEILEGVCVTLSKQDTATNHAQTVDYLTRVVQPIGTRWTAWMGQANVPVKHVVAEVERLTVLVRFLHVGSDAILEIMKSSWSLLEASTTRFPHDNVLAEKTCRLHKHALRACGALEYAPLLDSLMTVLVQSFAQSHQSPYLYAASICITEYGRDPSYVPRLFNMIVALSQTAFTFLQTLEDLTLHPDVVEELFYLMGRMMNYCPEPLVASPLLQSLFQCAVVGMQLYHRDANRGTLNFLESAVSYGRGDNLQAALRTEGQAVVTNLARAMMGNLPAYSVDTGSGSIAGIVWKLNRLCPDLLRPWMAHALQNAPERPRSDFLGALESGLERNDFNGAVRGFISACDRHHKLNRQ